MPGLETEANQRRSPDLHWRDLMAPGADCCRRATQSSREVGRGLRFFADSSWVNFTKKSISWDVVGHSGFVRLVDARPQPELVAPRRVDETICG